MRELPGGLADALHLLEPFPLRRLLVWLVALALAALWLYLRQRRRRRVPAPSPRPGGVETAGARRRPGGGLAEQIEQIWQGAESSRNYRRACHHLAWVLREHFEATSPEPWTRLTAREILERVGDTAPARLLERIQTLQFRRREPQRLEVEGVCDTARVLVMESGGKGRSDG